MACWRSKILSKQPVGTYQTWCIYFGINKRLDLLNLDPILKFPTWLTLWKWSLFAHFPVNKLLDVAKLASIRHLDGRKSWLGFVDLDFKYEVAISFWVSNYDQKSVSAKKSLESVDRFRPNSVSCTLGLAKVDLILVTLRSP